MNDDSRRLVDGEKLVVFVENAKRQVLGLRRADDLLGRCDTHRLAAGEDESGLTDLAVDVHPPGGDPGFRLRARRSDAALREKEIEP